MRNHKKKLCKLDGWAWRKKKYWNGRNVEAIFQTSSCKHGTRAWLRNLICIYMKNIFLSVAARSTLNDYHYLWHNLGYVARGIYILLFFLISLSPSGCAKERKKNLGEEKKYEIKLFPKKNTHTHTRSATSTRDGHKRDNRAHERKRWNRLIVSWIEHVFAFLHASGRVSFITERLLIIFGAGG